MLIKIVLVVLLLFIVFHLFRALLQMLKTSDSPNRMSKHLGRRVAFSVIVILLIVLSMVFGWIEPNSRPY